MFSTLDLGSIMGLYCTVISVYWNLWFVFGFRVEAPCASRQYAVRGSASGLVTSIVKECQRFMSQATYVTHCLWIQLRWLLGSQDSGMFEQSLTGQHPEDYVSKH